MSRTLRHAGAAAFFLISSLIWSFPLITRISTHLPGDGLGDNVTFLWNFWWMRHALSTAGEHGFQTFFQTHQIFAPFGADLTLHTHTALPAFLGATILRPLSPVVAQNVVILAALWLNGFAAYLLAFDRTRDFPASILAGLVFGGSPYLSLHMLGHFNLIHAWGLPLFALFLLRGLDSPVPPFEAAPDRRAVVRGRVAMVLAGLTLSATAYTDYYYFIFAAVLGGLLSVGRACQGGAHPISSRRVPRVLLVVLLAIVLADIGLIGAILRSGGFEITLAGRAIAARSITNPLSVLWVVLLLYVWRAWRWKIGVRVDAYDLRRVLAKIWPMVFVAAAGVLPLAVSAFSLWRHGDYVTATPSWRSGPGGIDLATVLLGNPMNAVTGRWTSAMYVSLGIDRIEKAAWIGLAPLGLAAYTLWTRATTPTTHRSVAFSLPVPPGSDLARLLDVRRWRWVGTMFFVWACGPWLTIAGTNAGLPLPQILFPYVPILSNARMPGRAMVVVMLAVALLCALAVRTIRRRAIVALLMAVVALDFVPAPFPTVAMARATEVNALLAAQPGGPGNIVCPLPLGLRDGYGEIGRFDGRVLLDQMSHGHAIAGGFIGRLSPKLRASYESAPVLRSLLTLSAGNPADETDLSQTPAANSAALLNQGIRFLVIDRGAAPDSLVAFAHDRLLVQLIGADSSGHELYEILKAAAQ